MYIHHFIDLSVWYKLLRDCGQMIIKPLEVFPWVRSISDSLSVSLQFEMCLSTYEMRCIYRVLLLRSIDASRREISFSLSFRDMALLTLAFQSSLAAADNSCKSFCSAIASSMQLSIVECVKPFRECSLALI